MKFLLIYMLSVSLLVAGEKHRSWYLPDHAKMQTAGNIGFLAFGLGKQFFNRRLESDFFYGYVPASIGGTSINTYAIKNSFQYYRPKFFNSRFQLPLYIGAAIFYVDDVRVNTITRQSVQLYNYPRNSVHIMPYLGVAFQFRNGGNKRQRWANIYLEVGALDTYLEDYFSEQNDEEQEWTEIINIAGGVRYDF